MVFLFFVHASKRTTGVNNFGRKTFPVGRKQEFALVNDTGARASDSETTNIARDEKTTDRGGG